LTQRKLTYRLNECIEFINDCLKTKKEGCLVHCNAGVSRSVSIVIAYMINTGMSIDFDQSLSIIRKTRAQARPNDGFRQQLIEYSNLSRDK
jgi:protein-tyrosine phosphatase